MLIDFAVPIGKYITPGIATTYLIMLENMSPKWHWIIKLNPLGHVIDSFNFIFLGAGSFTWIHLAYSASVAIVLLFIGVIVFNQVEKNFMDTV
jgi:lipopolysaccharide transport system permease protein